MVYCLANENWTRKAVIRALYFPLRKKLWVRVLEKDKRERHVKSYTKSFLSLLSSSHISFSHFLSPLLFLLLPSPLPGDVEWSSEEAEESGLRITIRPPCPPTAPPHPLPPPRPTRADTRRRGVSLSTHTALQGMEVCTPLFDVISFN